MNAGRVLNLENSEEKGANSTVVEALREHGAMLARVCMALLGDREATERALERVAKEAGANGRHVLVGTGQSSPPSASAKVFLMGLAHRACTTQLSKAPARARDDKDAAPASERVGEVAAADRARAALSALKPTERESVVLHLVGELDATEVATACGIDPKVAKERIGRALAQLAQSKEEGR